MSSWPRCPQLRRAADAHRRAVFCRHCVLDGRVRRYHGQDGGGTARGHRAEDRRYRHPRVRRQDHSGAPSRRRQPGDADGAQPPSTSAASSRGRCPGIPPRSHPADDFTKFVTVSQERGSTDPAIPAETPRSSPRSARHSSTVRVRPRHTRPDVHPRTTRTDAGLTQRAETGSVSFLHHQLRLRAASQVTLLRTRPVDAELSPLTVWAARDTARLYPSGTAAGGGSD